MFSKGRLKAKAAETRHLLPLAETLLEENAGLLGPKDRYLQFAIKELNKAHEIMNSEPRVMSDAGR
eukprot:856665-Pyramimonas_sp.AAC.1